MKQVSYHFCANQPLRKVFLCSKQWKDLSTKSVVSSGSSFDVKAGKKKWLVLDDYGMYDNGIPPEFAKDVFLKELLKTTVAIDRDTGEVLRASFYQFGPGDEEKEGFAMGLSNLYDDKPNPVVPAVDRPRLDVLKSAKRPFAFTLDFRQVCAFHTRDQTRADLQDAVRVQLFFSKSESMELRSGEYRLIGEWSSDSV